MAEEKPKDQLTDEWQAWAKQCREAEEAVEATTLFSGARADAETKYNALGATEPTMFKEQE